MIGTLHVGQLEGKITSLEFTGQILRVKAVFGHEQVGSMIGSAWITGTDGSVCWRGTKAHDYGVKTNEYPSVWNVTLDADLYDRTSVTIQAVFDPPSDEFREIPGQRSGA